MMSPRTAELLVVGAAALAVCCRCGDAASPVVATEASTPPSPQLRLKAEILPELTVAVDRVFRYLPLESGEGVLVVGDDQDQQVILIDAEGTIVRTLATFRYGRHQSAGPIRDIEIAAGGQGLVWIVTSFRGTLFANGTAIHSVGPPPVEGAYDNVMLLKVSTSDGAVIVSRQIGDGVSVFCPTVSTAGDSLYVLCDVRSDGRSSPGLDLASPDLSGEYNYLARLDPQGHTLWAQVIEGAYYPRTLVVDENAVVVAGEGRPGLVVQGKRRPSTDSYVDTTFIAIFAHDGELQELLGPGLGRGEHFDEIELHNADVVYTVAGPDLDRRSAVLRLFTRDGPGTAFTDSRLPCEISTCAVDSINVEDAYIILVNQFETTTEAILTTPDGTVIDTLALDAAEPTSWNVSPTRDAAGRLLEVRALERDGRTTLWRAMFTVEGTSPPR